MIENNEKKEECKICGYRLRKNSNRTLDTIYIDITLPTPYMLKVVYTKTILVCNQCRDTLINTIDGIINNTLYE